MRQTVATFLCQSGHGCHPDETRWKERVSTWLTNTATPERLVTKNYGPAYFIPGYEKNMLGGGGDKLSFKKAGGQIGTRPANNCKRTIRTNQANSWV